MTFHGTIQENLPENYWYLLQVIRSNYTGFACTPNFNDNVSVLGKAVKITTTLRGCKLTLIKTVTHTHIKHLQCKGSLVEVQPQPEYISRGDRIDSDMKQEWINRISWSTKKNISSPSSLNDRVRWIAVHAGRNIPPQQPGQVAYHPPMSWRRPWHQGRFPGRSSSPWLWARRCPKGSRASTEVKREVVWLLDWGCRSPGRELKEFI